MKVLKDAIFLVDIYWKICIQNVKSTHVTSVNFLRWTLQYWRGSIFCPLHNY